MERLLRALSGRGPLPDFKPYAPEDVERSLAEVKDALERRTADLRRHGLGAYVLLEPREEEQARVGSFHVAIYESPDALERSHSAEDGEGFDWEYIVPERGDSAPSWVANKAYGNVRLTWSAPEQREDERLTRLDRALSQLRS
jgi:hypothetical protein